MKKDPYDISCDPILFDPISGRMVVFSNSIHDPDLWLDFPIYSVSTKPYITKSGRRIYLDAESIGILRCIMFKLGRYTNTMYWPDENEGDIE